MKNKIIKIIKNFNENGLKNTIKKIILYLRLKFKSEIVANKKRLYIIKKKNKKNIFYKNLKKAFIVSSYPVYYNDGDYINNHYANILNEMGYLVEYYYLNNYKNQTNTILPVSKHIKIKNKINVNISDNDIFILDHSLKKYVHKSLLKKAYILNGTKEENVYNNCIRLVDKKGYCNHKFYENISIIVLNYNNMGIIDTCIDSLLKHNGRYNYEVIVVDNRSVDGSYENLIKKYTNKIKLIQNSKNGCSSGRNLGVNLSNRKYIMFLDSDQWVLNDYWLDNYLDIIDNSTSIGAIGWAAGWFNKKGYACQVTDNFPYRYMPPNGLYRDDIGYLGTGGMILERKLFNEIDGFDINYDPTCYEDTDISMKIRNVGKKIVYCPYLGIKHLPHQTTKSGSDNHTKLIMEKGNYFVNKWTNINKSLLKDKKFIK
ncbi:MAG: glycosyltransferase family 2 protein [Ignavibacteriales bacterium]